MLPFESDTELHLRDYVQTLRRRKAVIALCTLVVLAAAVAVSLLQTPLYASTAKILLRPRTTQSVFGSEAQPRDPARSVDTEIEVIKTEPVRELVKGQIGSAPPVSVGAVGQTDLVAIRAESTSARRAADVANSYANAYIEFRRKQTLDDLYAGSEEVQTKITELQEQIDGLPGQIDNAPACTDARSCSQRANVEQSVAQRRTTLLSQQALFRQRLDQLQVDASLANGGAQLVTPASPPRSPFKPTPRRNALLGLMFGVLLGIGFAIVLEHLDDTVKTREDVEKAIPALSVLALIPAVPDWKIRSESRIDSISHPTSSVAEAYKILRTSIQFIGLDKDVRVIQVTSPNAQEGKTTTLANLAVAMARSGLRTVAVDCDLRCARLHEFFELKNDIGFTSILLGSVSLPNALQSIPGQNSLLVLPSGPLPPNPSELLASTRTADLFRNLRSQADVILIDSPPALPVTDALVLSQRADATVLVASAGTTTYKAVTRAAAMLKQVNAPLIGGVLIGASDEESYGSYSNRYYARSGANSEPVAPDTGGDRSKAESKGRHRVVR